jgi:hypothetical protein
MLEYETTIREIEYKYSAEFEQLKAMAEEGIETLDDLTNLYVQIWWTCEGAIKFAEEDDIMQVAEHGSRAERNARKRVFEAIDALGDLGESIPEAVESRSEAAGKRYVTVPSLEEYRRKRAS